MQINGSSHVHGPHAPSGPYSARSNAARAANPSMSTVDQLDISAAAEAAAKAVDGGDIRADLVARIRNEIAAGTYETADKLDSALEGLLDDIA
jgi:negative regulator of flagellin synthesis FlgM